MEPCLSVLSRSSTGGMAYRAEKMDGLALDRKRWLILVLKINCPVLFESVKVIKDRKG